MKYRELGIGNRWLVHTEFEENNGKGYEKRGIIGVVST
ncbi:DUF3977 family protein [Bacillus ndiopicus]